MSVKQVIRVCLKFTRKSGVKHYFQTSQRVCRTICNTVYLPEILPYWLTFNGGELFLSLIHYRCGKVE